MVETLRYHPASEIFPMMDADNYRELVADIGQNGLREPIWLHPDGSVLDGRNRIKACLEAGVEPRFQQWDGRGSPVSFVVSLNLHRRHLTPSQSAMVGARIKPMFEAEAHKRFGVRTDLIRNLPANLPEGSEARESAAQAVGVSPRSVQSAAVVLDRGIPELVEAVDLGEMAVSVAAKVAVLPVEQQREVIARPHVANNSGENEWYTPKPYIEVAREVMGRIDLDPASCELANRTVQAEAFFSLAENGLTQEWHGSVWLNPPYAQPAIAQFCDKVICEFKSGRVSQACVLVNNGTETAWGQSLLSACSAVCFPSSRIRFIGPNGEKGAPLQGQMFLYFGTSQGVERFRFYADKFGVVKA